MSKKNKETLELLGLSQGQYLSVYLDMVLDPEEQPVAYAGFLLWVSSWGQYVLYSPQEEGVGNQIIFCPVGFSTAYCLENVDSESDKTIKNFITRNFSLKLSEKNLLQRALRCIDLRKGSEAVFISFDYQSEGKIGGFLENQDGISLVFREQGKVSITPLECGVIVKKEEGKEELKKRPSLYLVK